MKLFPHQPFVESQDFVGALSDGTVEADDLHLIVEYCLSRNQLVCGKVLGDESSHAKLTKFIDRGLPLLRLLSRKPDEANTRVESQQVVLERITRPHAGIEQGVGVFGIVGQFHLNDLTVTRRQKRFEFSDRVLTFLLTGPEGIWNANWYARDSFTGESKVTVEDPRLDLEGGLPFTIDVVPRFFHDTSSQPDSYGLRTHVLTLQCTTGMPVQDLSDVDFISQARNVVDDLLLLASFLSRNWIAWYGYFFETSDFIQRHLKRTRECSSGEPHRHEFLLDVNDSKTFFPRALHNLHKLRAEGFDLQMPLVYYVSATDDKYVEEQFTLLFLALERVKDLFACTSDGFKEILPETEFESLVKTLHKQIRSAIPDRDRRRLVYQKMRELNRPSLSSVLNAMLQRLEVKWEDLYPPAARCTLIDTRDSLFHSSEPVDYPNLILELHRLKALVERVLLSLLGSRDFSRSPGSHTRHEITETN